MAIAIAITDMTSLIIVQKALPSATVEGIGACLPRKEKCGPLEVSYIGSSSGSRRAAAAALDMGKQKLSKTVEKVDGKILKCQ